METIRCKNNLGGYSDVPKEKFFFRPSVYGVILKNNQILLLSNKSNGKYWFPGGGVEIGEKIEDALKREFKEETGLEVRIIKPLLFKENFFYYKLEDAAYHALIWFFECEQVSDKELVSDDLVDDTESEKPRWISIDDLKNQDFSDLEADCMLMIQSLTKEQG